MRRVVLLLASTVGLTGCATAMPQLTQTYFLPKAETDFTVIETLGCNADNSALVTAVNVSAPTHYIPDYDNPQAFNIGKLGGGGLSDTDFTISMQPDGRLSGVNSTATGEGGAVVTAAVGLVSAATGKSPLTTKGNIGQQANPPAIVTQTPLAQVCGIINTYGTTGGAGGTAAATTPGDPAADPGKAGKAGKAVGAPPPPAAPDGTTPPKAKVLTLTFELNAAYVITAPATANVGSMSITGVNLVTWSSTVPASTAESSVNLVPTVDSSVAYAALTDALSKIGLPDGTLNFSLQKPTEQRVLETNKYGAGSSDSFTPIKINRLGVVTLTLLGPKISNGTGGNINVATDTIYTSEIVTPSRDTTEIPLPKGQTFGKSSASVTLDDSGQVTVLKYSNTSGVADALGAGKTVASAIVPQASSPTQQAANVQAKADLIYEQQRLVTCQLEASQCTAK